jgi:N-acetylglutamate synthase-like GNAT family acetyltransferase
LCAEEDVMIRPCTDADVPAIEIIVNDAAQKYRGVIPPDCWREPYMPHHELLGEIAAGVRFWAWQEDSGALIGVMGMQKVPDATLIRHAYVLSGNQSRGIGGALLNRLLGQSSGRSLVGTWAAAGWAIRFYQRHGFRLVSAAEKDRLLQQYWRISKRQQETSVILEYLWHGRRSEPVG